MKEIIIYLLCLLHKNSLKIKMKRKTYFLDVSSMHMSGGNGVKTESSEEILYLRNIQPYLKNPECRASSITR